MPIGDKNIGRIKGNIKIMIDKDAPDEDINGYLVEEGVSVADLKAPPQSTPVQAPPAQMPVPRVYGSALSIPGSDKADLGKDVGSMISNIPSDIAHTTKLLYQAVRHPYDTAKGLSLGLLGGVSKLVPGQPKEGSLRQVGEQVAGQIGAGLKQDYGGAENIKKRLIEHPVGSLMDVAGGIGLAGVGLKSPALIKAANTIDPFVQAGKLFQKTARFAGKNVAAPVLGGLTGKGELAIKKAYESSPAFVGAMKGTIHPEAVIDNLRGSLEAVKMDRAHKYQKAWSSFSKTANAPVDIAPLKNTFDGLVKRFNMKVGDDGLVTTKFRTLDSKTIHERVKILNEIKAWMDDPAPKTLLHLDDLKRQLDDFYIDSSKNRAIVQTMRDMTKNHIIKNDASYEKMVQDYAKTSDLIKELEQTFSLQGGAKKRSADTVMRKVITAMREDADFRRNLLERAETVSGVKNLDEQLAGYLMSSKIPGGLVGKGIGASALIGSLYAFDPKLVALMMVSSPRLTGEFLTVLASARKAAAPIVKPIAKAAPVLTKAGYQAGRLTERNQEE